LDIVEFNKIWENITEIENNYDIFAFANIYFMIEKYSELKESFDKK